MTFLENSNLILQFSHAKPLERGILGASTIILSKDVYKYAFTCGLNFYEPHVTVNIDLVSLFWTLSLLLK